MGLGALSLACPTLPHPALHTKAPARSSSELLLPTQTQS